MPSTHAKVGSSAKRKQELSQRERERLLPWLAEKIRGKTCSVPEHQKWRSSETTVLDYRANKRQSFFDNVEFGKSCLEAASGSFCVQVYRTLNTISFN